MTHLLQFADGFIQQPHLFEGDAQVVMCLRVFCRLRRLFGLFLKFRKNVAEALDVSASCMSPLMTCFSKAGAVITATLFSGGPLGTKSFKSDCSSLAQSQ